ncbi:MAG: helix-turn-helix domain-containing protein [Minisyncoccales bacterium]
MERLKLYYGVSTYSDVAHKLNISYDTVKSWSSRKKVVTDTLLNCMRDEPINVNWLLYGDGKMKISELEQLEYDIEKIEQAFNNSLDPKILKSISESEHLQKLISLFAYAPEEFILQIIKRLEQFKEMSKV